jgi:tetratricopeptide (TPR) repeat protein
LEYLSLANQKALGLNAVEPAMAYFEEAMKLLDGLPDSITNRERRISLIANQLYVFLLLLRISEYSELLKSYEPIAKELGNPGLLGAFYARWTHCDWWFGDFDGAIQRGTKAIELLKSAESFEAIDSAYLGVAWGFFYKCLFDKFIDFKKNMLHIAERHNLLRLHVIGLSQVVLTYACLGRWDEALQEGQEALALAEEYSDNHLISFASFSLSFAYVCMGDLTQGVEQAEIAVQKAPTLANKAWAQSFLALALCRAGETQKGIGMLENLVPMYRFARYLAGQVYGMVMLGEGYFLAGEYDKAREMLEECSQLAERHGMQYWNAWAQLLLGEVALKTNSEKAHSHFEKSITIFEKIKAENDLALAYAGYGRLYKKQSKKVEARKYLTMALEIFQRLGTLIEPDKVRQELEE